MLRHACLHLCFRAACVFVLQEYLSLFFSVRHLVDSVGLRDYE